MTDKEKFNKIKTRMMSLPNIYVNDDMVWLINLITKNESHIEKLEKIIDRTRSLALLIKTKTIPAGEDFGDEGVCKLAEKIISVTGGTND